MKEPNFSAGAILEPRRPLIITGTGRCGSTILHRVLARHPVLAWFSQVCESRPRQQPWLNRLAMHGLDFAPSAPALRARLYPTEAYRFWKVHCPEFAEPFRDLIGADVMPSRRDSVRSVLGGMLTAKRNRMLLKVTGWPRIGFLKEMLPDAKFIHVYRDGRAVANSIVNVRWWQGWRGPTGWRLGELNTEEQAKWEEHGQSFLVLAGIGWEILMAAQERAKQALPAEDLLEIRYEELCADPARFVRRAVDFAGLEWTPGFHAAVERLPFRNTNHKWQEQLSQSQQQQLNACLGATLKEYGYA